MKIGWKKIESDQRKQEVEDVERVKNNTKEGWKGLENRQNMAREEQKITRGYGNKANI